MIKERLWEKHIRMIPAHMREGMLAWIENGILPGQFLQAVLKNNLLMAFLNADCINKRKMETYLEYLWKYAPEDCWGSKENVRKWHKQKVAERGGNEDNIAF